jgi:Dolichyl-phosphate-mannose-protein mannosyltransferase
VKEEIETPSVQPGASNTAVDSRLQVEIRVREAEEPASEVEEAALSAAQQWIIRLMVLGVVLVIGAVYVGAQIGDGWVPADDGTLSQSALRVMQGQLPHRDFAEIYTGGLSLIHALAFRVFGVSLMSLRLCVFLFFLAWIPAVYYIALRFTSTIAAAFITLLAVEWSFPNYPAAMPSWYNLFFASFGAAALLRYLEVRKTRWLFIAGVCGGASILIKVIGAYYIAGVLLFLAFLEQSEEPGDHEGNGAGKGAIAYRLFSASALLLFLATVLWLVRARLGGAEFYHFVMPAAVLVALVLLAERNSRSESAGKRFGRLLRLALPFAGGVLAPVAAFLALYARSGSVGSFFSGVTSSAISHSVGLAVLRPAPIEKAIFPLILAALVAAAMYRRELQGGLQGRLQGKIAGIAVAAGLAVILLKATTSAGIVSGVWFSVATLTPLVVVLGAMTIFATNKRDAHTKISRQRIMLLISLAAMCSLVQYSFAAPIYLCYSLPLTILATVAIVSTAKKQPGLYILSAVMGFYLLFGVVMLIPDHIYELTHKVGQVDELQLERAGGLRIEYAANFAELIHFLQQHSPNGLMYAGNDCPELYFLSGLKNVTRDDGGARTDDVLKALQAEDLNLVVINESPFFPGAVMDPEVRATVTMEFPQSVRFGIFHVFWKR